MGTALGAVGVCAGDHHEGLGRRPSWNGISIFIFQLAAWPSASAFPSHTRVPLSPSGSAQENKIKDTQTKDLITVAWSPRCREAKTHEGSEVTDE